MRIIKKFDLRNYETVADVEPGTYNVSMAVSDNRVFVGADRGKVMEFDGTFLELVHDYSAAFGHVKNLGFVLLYGNTQRQIRTVIFCID